ncbi:hypothetical protein [Methylophaga sp.]|nr:hypothetical protein [Methylophaga sp.]MDO8828078.1 hypothetical protein [Methylophaga sp.]
MYDEQDVPGPTHSQDVFRGRDSTLLLTILLWPYNVAMAYQRCLFSSVKN